MTRELRTGAAGTGAGGAFTGADAPIGLSVERSVGLSGVLSREFLSELAVLGSVVFDCVVFGESFALVDSPRLSAADCCVTGNRDGGGTSRFSGIDGGTGRDDATVAAGVAGLGRIVLESSVPDAEVCAVALGA